MKRTINFLMLTALVGIIAFGCGSNPNPTDSGNGIPATSGKIVVPDGASLESATLNLYITEADNQVVNVHRITAAWDENVVTWENFGGAYDDAVWSSYTADATGWKTVDVTSLVQAWWNGTYDNFGLLLEHDNFGYPATKYNTKEADMYRPYLSFCYTLDGETFCVDDVPVGDTYIWEYAYLQNFGSYDYMFIGWGGINQYGLEKQALFQFDFEVEEEPDTYGCTLTIGYWKTHAGFGPQADVVTQYLPIRLGTEGGDKSLSVNSAFMAVTILSMDTFGWHSNGITKLYAQLLGAKLNMAAGADYSVIEDELSEADAFLAGHDWKDWYTLDDDEKDSVLKLKSTFDDYNNGIIGPGHCENICDGNKFFWGKRHRGFHHNYHFWKH